VWQLPVESLLTGGLGTLPLAPISDVAKEDVPGVIRQMKQRLAQPQARARAPELWTATRILLGLRYDEEFAQVVLQGVRGMRESVTYQAIVAEGRAEGLAEGRVEGLAEGLAKGRLEGARRVLLRLGEKKFHSAPDATVRAAVEAINDEERLEQLTDNVLRVASWEELLKETARPRRKGKRKGKA
jgi:predicted transposase YdaD